MDNKLIINIKGSENNANMVLSSNTSSIIYKN